MMKIEFKPLLTVEIFHNYYVAKQIPDLEIIPTEACQQLLRNYGLLFRKNNNGFAVHYEVGDNGDSHPRKPIAETARFSFILRPVNPYLLNFSDLPFTAPSNLIYYLNNLNKDSETVPLLLTSSTSSSFLSSDDSLESKPLRFEYRATSADTSALIEIKDEWSKVVITKARPVIRGKLHYLVDLRAHGPGKYTLFLNGNQKTEFYASDEIFGENIFAVIDILRDNLVHETYQITDPDNAHAVSAKTFTIRINNRATVWKYNVVLKYRQDTEAEDLTIQFFTPPENGETPGNGADTDAASPPTTFERNDSSTRPDGLTVIPFVARDKLPLVEKPLERIQLVKESRGNNGPFTIDSLTNPSIKCINKDKQGKLYSEMYVYI